MRPQRWENGPYFAAFSLHIPDMRSFLHVRDIVKICPRSPIVSIKTVFHCRTPESGTLLVRESQATQIARPGDCEPMPLRLCLLAAPKRTELIRTDRLDIDRPSINRFDTPAGSHGPAS